MAGEIEEPFHFNLQADLLHSGSISFGRFESESLSWERRSSFSHNRYLEEVEKYSKPGSVTEKKAYFEAHFKRKALLKQASCESQDRTEFQTSENNYSQESDNGEEIEIHKPVKENVETLCAENSHATSFDESLYNLGYEASEIVECEIQELGHKSIINTIEHHMVNDTEDLKLKETDQAGTKNVVLVKSEEDTKEIPNGSSKVRPSSDTKEPKPKVKAHATVAPVRRINSSEASNSFAKSKTTENKSLVMKEKEKKLPRPASPIVPSGSKTSKSQDSSTSFPKPKMLPLNKSVVKEYRAVKTMERKSSVLEKSLPGARQTGNRTKPTARKPHVNQASAGFTFMSDQRAEKRKEEKKAAELAQAQLRKSLNFKATPMPCFYKEAARSSDQTKLISSSKSPHRPRTPSYTRPPSSSASSLNMSKNRPSERLTKSYVSEKKKESHSSHKQKQPQPPRPKGTHIRYLPPTIAT